MFKQGRTRLLLIGLVGLIVGITLALKAHSEASPALLKKITLPAGFSIQRYADVSNIGRPRMMQFDRDGALYVALVDSDKIIKLVDSNHDGIADTQTVVAKGLNNPNSVAILDDLMLISNEDSIVKLTRQGEQWSPPQPFISKLPTGGHTLKTVRIGPDKHIYINVGSSCNVCIESEPKRATILRYTLDGQSAGHLVTVGRHAPSPIWATGLRNSQGYAWHPVTGEMFATNEGADNRSETKNGKVNDELPPEHINRIQAGGFYGWPYCWADPAKPNALFQDPNFLGSDGICQTGTAPAITLTSHSTPIGISFLHQSHFPADYQSDAIIALHGSWNRKNPSGYALVRVQFKNHQPVSVVPYAEGWLQQGSQAWGRPVDVAVGLDGALYVSDDKTGWIYRISYDAKH